MKRLFCIGFAVCLLAVTASADVIWAPNDDFYNQHYEECEYLGRSYYTNGQEGGVALYQRPGSGYVHVLENGIELYLSFIYADAAGTIWGVAEFNNEGDTGWVDMADLLLIYDNQAFIEEHETEFLPYDGAFEELCTSEDQRVIVWTYPGSGRINCDLEHLNQSYSPLAPDVTWTDAEGRVWGRFGYFMAARGWVCLSDPGNEKLPVIEREYDLYPTGNLAEVGEASSITFGNIWGVSLAVLAVCAVTAVLVFRMKKKA